MILLENKKQFNGNMTIGSYLRGEIVFQTGMTGYIEAITDPSYKDQILVFTYPMVGNYSVSEKMMESENVCVKGVIVRTADVHLVEFLKKHNIPLMTGVDTRALTIELREKGTMIGELWDGVSEKINTTSLISPNYKTKQIGNWSNTTSKHVLVVDVGIKKSQITYLVNLGFKLTIIKGENDFLSIVNNPKESIDGVFISNGPGDPKNRQTTIDQLTTLMSNDSLNIPIFGICLGHQLIALAGGNNTKKMKYGNRGQNIPVRLLNGERGYITTQNHGYEVILNKESGFRTLFTNLNDGSNEGIYHLTKPIFSVQFHPEARPGPWDCEFLFDVFKKLIENPRVNTINLFDDVNQVTKKRYKKVLVLGSGGLTIGQAGEFDYSGSQALKGYKEEGLETVLINPNIATVQTTTGIGLADKIYSLPITSKYVEEIIQEEKPDCIAISYGGQTALNCATQLYKMGILDKYDVEILGTNIQHVINSEDRAKFKEKIANIPYAKVAQSISTNDIKVASKFASNVGYPVLVRSGFALGGLGSGFATNEKELIELMNGEEKIIDKSLRGWREVEYEIVRDSYGNCIIVCNMENFDPVGVHTGESIVVAPSQTLNDEEYFLLREMAIKVANEFEIVGECNIQYALHPHTAEFYIIEINARLSRSSALASKATGYPLAYIASKLSLGYSLLELKNVITKKTSAMFEPSLDYCVVKIPKWDLNKFENVDTTIGTAMKSVGEIMSIGATFEEALMKGIRLCSLGVEFDKYLRNSDHQHNNLTNPYVLRVLDIICYGDFKKESGVGDWFLRRTDNIRAFISNKKSVSLSDALLTGKQLGFSDHQLSVLYDTTESVIKKMREELGIYPKIKKIDTVAGEFPCNTNYMYMTYHGEFDEIQNNIKNSLLIIGSGVYRIGSSVEFDWCSVNCVKTCKELGYNTMMLNYNPETVSTDYDMVNYLLFDEISVEVVTELWRRNLIQGVVVSVGGQESNNIVMGLERNGVKIIGTDAKMIDNAENRYKFSRSLDRIGVDQPEWKELTSLDDAIEFCNKVSYPCLIRPSYVLSGAAMNVAFDDRNLVKYLSGAVKVSGDYPVVISKFIIDAKEIEVDAVAMNGEPIVTIISEHIENAGVHSGDASLVSPPQDLTHDTVRKIKDSVKKIAKELNINGPFNLQFIAKNDEIKVIECNLRSSRSFPFVSKVYDINLIDIATRVMLNKWVKGEITITADSVGVKVPQFSFKRLPGADCVLGVEMKSTGEVATFGSDHKITFLKSLLSSGYKIPRENSKILVSVGSMRYKKEMLKEVRTLDDLGYDLYGTSGTADFYKDYGISINKISWTKVNNFIETNELDFVFNISMLDRIKLLDDDRTNGYKLRMSTIRRNIPMLTDVKASRMFIGALQKYRRNPSLLNMDIRVDVKESKLVDDSMYNDNADQEYNEDKIISSFKNKSIVSVSQFTRSDLRLLFERAEAIMNKKYKNKSLTDKIIGFLFTEPSTRTECSFESAVKRLGGKTLKVSKNSSIKKGETIQDTVRCLEQYCEGLIIRGDNKIIDKCLPVLNNALINAGNGSIEHPTQALLDLFTIREERGSITGLTITIVGDLQYSRTVHSLVKLLCNYKIRKINYLPATISSDAHTKKLEVPKEIYNYVQERGVKQKTVDHLNEVIETTDVIYMTRLQKERHSYLDGTEHEIKFDYTKLNPTSITRAKNNMIIMHPLPRNDEIDTSLDEDPRSAYFRQMKYGLYLRMALLDLVFGKN